MILFNVPSDMVSLPCLRESVSLPDGNYANASGCSTKDEGQDSLGRVGCHRRSWSHDAGLFWFAES